MLSSIGMPCLHAVARVVLDEPEDVGRESTISSLSSAQNSSEPFIQNSVCIPVGFSQTSVWIAPGNSCTYAPGEATQSYSR